MQISPINFSNIQRITNFKNLSFKGISDIKGDTFEKSTDRLFSAENLREIFLNPENEIGHGANNTVYSIPDNNKYVLRVGKGYFQPQNITTAEYTDLDKHEDFNIGQLTGRIKTDGGILNGPQLIEVLKKQEGKSYGVPDFSAISDEYGNLLPNEAPYEDYSRKLSFKTLLDKVSSMDTETYEKMLETFNKAQNAGYSFDPLNVNNLLVADDAINMIDFEKSSIKCSYLELLNLLTNHDYIKTYYMAPDIDEYSKHEAYEQTLTVIRKFLQAMQNKGLKFNCDYIRNKGSIDLLKSNEFKNAIGYDRNSGISLAQYLEDMGLFDSTLENSRQFFAISR